MENSEIHVTVDLNGLVIGAPHTIPHPLFNCSSDCITTLPIVAPTCELQYFIIDNGDTYQWQLSTNGTTWNDIVNNTATYSNATTNTLTSVTNGMNGFKYRVQLNKIGNSCGLNSNETTLTVYPLPIVNDCYTM
jgi:hypothetical protein